MAQMAVEIALWVADARLRYFSGTSLVHVIIVPLEVVMTVEPKQEQ